MYDPISTDINKRPSQCGKKWSHQEGQQCLKSCGHPESKAEAEVTCPMLLRHFEFKVLKECRRDRVWDTSVSAHGWLGWNGERMCKLTRKSSVLVLTAHPRPSVAGKVPRLRFACSGEWPRNHLFVCLFDYLTYICSL